MDPVPMDSRGGLVLIGATATAPPLPWHQKLLVCNPATGRRLVLPPEPEPFPNGGCSRERYVLLVGDRDDGEGGAAVGRPFQVVKVKLLLSQYNSSYCRLLVQSFSRGPRARRSRLLTYTGGRSARRRSWSSATSCTGCA
jgi:hypothetical protein